MTIFKSSEDNDTADVASTPEAGKSLPVDSKNVSVIGSTLVFKGELSADEDLIIEGRVEGKIAHHKKHLTVGEHGYVKADIDASSVIVLGQLIGNIHSEGIVSLAKGADVTGNIFCGRIVMEDGARFKGNVDMGDPPKKTAVPKESAKVDSVGTQDSKKVSGRTAKASVY